MSLLIKEDIAQKMNVLNLFRCNNREIRIRLLSAPLFLMVADFAEKNRVNRNRNLFKGFLKKS